MHGHSGTKPALGYVAVVNRGAHDGYAVSFPDVPGCVAAGLTVDEAMRAARDALERRFAACREAGEPVPAARDFHQVIMSTDRKGAIAFIMI